MSAQTDREQRRHAQTKMQRSRAASLERRRSDLERLAAARREQKNQDQKQEPEQQSQPETLTDQQRKDIAAFRKAIEQVPSSLCVCCEWRLYPDETLQVQCNNPALDVISTLLPAEPQVDGKRVSARRDRVTLCKSCFRKLKAKKLPKFCVLNGLQLGQLPEAVANLTLRERSLICPVQCFQQIHALPLGQRASKGLSIFMPIDSQRIVDTLPRVDGDSSVIRVQIPPKHVSSDPVCSCSRFCVVGGFEAAGREQG